MDQHREVGDVAVVHGAAVGVDVLAEQVDLAHALLGELGHLDDDVVERTADFLAARVRHHAVGAILRAAFHDRDEGGGAFGAGLGQAVELLDLREADVHLRLAAGTLGFDHFRQAVQRLWAEHEVHIGCALEDGIAFLRGHATADADEHRLAAGFVGLPAAELAEDFLLGLFADRTGVDQDDVSFRFVLGQLETVRCEQDVGHLGRVVLVHLAAVGLDEKLAAHGPGYRDSWEVTEPRSLRRHHPPCHRVWWINDLREEHHVIGSWQGRGARAHSRPWSKTRRQGKAPAIPPAVFCSPGRPCEGPRALSYCFWGWLPVRPRRAPY